MFKEEKVIDGVLHRRSTPDGEWVKCSDKYITNKLVEAQTSSNTAYTKCVEELMRDISGRRGYDLFECDEDIVDDIKQSLEAIIRTHFA